MKKFRKGHWYEVQDELGRHYVGQFMGRQEGFSCSVCGMGYKCFCFNSWYGTGDLDYETIAYGPVHMPTIIKELGKTDYEEEIIVNK